MKRRNAKVFDDQELGKHIAEWVLANLVREGIITTEGKTTDEIRKELYSYLATMCIEKRPMLITLDYTDEFLADARRYDQEDYKELSCLFYALWFEHTLNGIVVLLSNKRGLTHDDASAIMRKTSAVDKCTWVLSLLGANRILKSHVKTIETLMNARNGFVHYKHKPQGFEEEFQFDARNVEKAIRYLRAYEGRLFPRLTKNTSKKVIRKNKEHE